jgi:Regulator of polyketide synthase expression
MGISIETIAQKLQHYHPHIVMNNFEISMVETLELAEQRPKELQAETLYFSLLSEWVKRDGKSEEGNFICIQDQLLPYEPKIGPKTNFILLRTACELEPSFNEVLTIFRTYNRVGYSLARLMTPLLSGRDIPSVLEIAREILGNPVLLLSAGGGVIAKTDLLELENDHFYLRQIMQSNNAKALAGAESWSNLLSLMRPSLHQYDAIDKPNIVSVVRINCQPVAIMVVIEHTKPFTEEDLEICAYFCEILTTNLQRHPSQNLLNHSAVETFFSDMIFGKLTDTTEMTRRAAELGLPSDAYTFLFTIKIPYQDDHTVNEFCEAVSRDLPNMQAFYLKNNSTILILTAEQKTPFLPQGAITDLSDLLAQTGMIAGLSPGFKKWSDLKSRHDLSRKAEKYGSYFGHKKSVYNYQDYQIYHLLDTCRQYVSLEDFIAPVCHEMIAYDRANNTEYVKTLFHYIQCAKDSAKTAESLYIHRNTVFYRLERMKEIFLIDFGDDRTLQSLHISLTILNMTALQ